MGFTSKSSFVVFIVFCCACVFGKEPRFIEIANFDQEVVEVQLFYETLCPYCVTFLANDLRNAVTKLADNMDVKLYPYGNAKTINHDDGSFEIECQHGPPECYGNQLHACAIQAITNTTSAVLFNACVIDKSSDDAAVQTCAEEMSIDGQAIIECAKSDQGLKLHKHYGELTPTHPGVPWVLINGEKFESEDLLGTLCKTFKNPPPACTTN